MNDTITISTHKDFMGDADEYIVELYKKYAKKNLLKLGYSDIEFSETQNTYSINAPISNASDEYRDMEDALEDAWTHALN